MNNFQRSLLCMLVILAGVRAAYAPPGDYSHYMWLDRAVAYAATYCDGINPQYGEAGYWGNEDPPRWHSLDCANFTTQVAQAGCLGMAESNASNDWDLYWNNPNDCWPYYNGFPDNTTDPGCAYNVEWNQGTYRAYCRHPDYEGPWFPRCYDDSPSGQHQVISIAQAQMHWLECVYSGWYDPPPDWPNHFYGGWQDLPAWVNTGCFMTQIKTVIPGVRTDFHAVFIGYDPIHTRLSYWAHNRNRCLTISLLSLFNESPVDAQKIFGPQFVSVEPQDMSWHQADSPIQVTINLRIPPDGTLTVEAGTTVIFSPGISVTIADGGRILADGGTLLEPINFVAMSNDPADAWRGLLMYSNAAENVINNCHFENASVGVRALPGSNFTVSNSTFDNCGIGVTSTYGGQVTLSSCSITNSRYYGAVSAANATLTITGGTITGCARTGVWAAGIATIHMTGTELSLNGPILQINRNLQFGGVRNTHGSMELRCISSRENYGPGLTTLGGTIDMAPNAKNVFHNNLAVNGPRAQIFVCSTIPDMCNGRNLVMGTNGDLIQDCNGGAFPADVTGNHWGGDPTGRIPSTWVNNGNDNNGTIINRCAIQPDFNPCGGVASYQVFHEGWIEENSGQWIAAIQSYDSVMKFWPGSKEAKLCPDRILYCEGMSQKNWQGQRAHFLSVADTTHDADLKFAARASAAWCLVEMDSLPKAQIEYQNLMNQADSDYKYQKAALEALLTELKNAPWDSISSVSPGPPAHSGKSAGLDEEVSNDPEIAVYSRIEDLLSGSFVPSRREPIPTQYALFQNYPNPFNPITEIRFDLPENAHVKLTIFNTLGQKVATVLDEVRQAGAYRVQWDGSGVASGLYIYQIRAGNFTDSKKMVLMR